MKNMKKYNYLYNKYDPAERCLGHKRAVHVKKWYRMRHNLLFIGTTYFVTYLYFMNNAHYKSRFASTNCAFLTLYFE